MKTKYVKEYDLLEIKNGASPKDGSTLRDEGLVSVAFPDDESHAIVELEVVNASFFFADGYNPDTDVWTLGTVKGADLIEEHGDFVGYWEEYRFDDGDTELSAIGVELRQVSKHIPRNVMDSLRA